MFLSTVNTDIKYVAFFGETQRRNGFISYLALSLIFLASVMFIRIVNLKKIYTSILITASIFSCYAILQTTGNDFIEWNNPYNAIIGTVGNPNFAGALMAIMGVVLLSSCFTKILSLNLRILAIILSLLLILLIIRSNARQGVLAYVLGVGTFLTIWLFTKNRILGIYALICGTAVFIFSILGMLQIGPLQSYLYKNSVSVRGYYWRAGVEMFRNNPLFGVGIDRYGAYFKEFREVGYPLTYNFEITSSNAHNTFIQFFATGGVFLGLSYLILNGYILKLSLNRITKTTGNEKLIISGLFSAWVAFHAQSLVSIDNLGVSIWGWILGGILVGLSVTQEQNSKEYSNFQRNRKQVVNLERATVSGFAAILCIVLVGFLFRGESNAFQASSNFNDQDQTSRMIYRDLQIRTIESPLADPYYKLMCAERLIRSGFLEEGIAEVKQIHKTDPRNLDALVLLSIISDRLNLVTESINYRLKISQLDPWNASNYLELGKNYKSQGDEFNTALMLEKIISFAPKHPIAESAKELLAP